MICRICGINMDEYGLDNVSPICGYPVCSHCGVEAISCNECWEGSDELVYVEDNDKVMCKKCLIEWAEKQGIIHSAKRFFSADWEEIGTDDDYEPIIECIKSWIDVQGVKT